MVAKFVMQPSHSGTLKNVFDLQSLTAPLPQVILLFGRTSKGGLYLCKREFRNVCFVRDASPEFFAVYAPPP